MVNNLIVILGDQLTEKLAVLRTANRDTDIVFMAEVRGETDHARYHKKKLAFVFSAMRHFAERLREIGWTVEYTRLTDKKNAQSIVGEVIRAIEKLAPDKVIVTESGKWDLNAAFRKLRNEVEIPVHIEEDGRFFCSHAEFESWAKGRSSLTMEYFYRYLRKETGLLMDGNEPMGGKWNFDRDNRKPLKKDVAHAGPKEFEPDDITQEVLDLIDREFPNNFGSLTPFRFAVTSRDAELAFEHFVETALPLFGDYQDAMVRDQSYLYHSVIALYLNVGLLDPSKVCKRVAQSYEDGQVPLNSAEGFIRQILGWREFVRGVYWQTMPGYLSQNFFDHQRDLPDFYWSGETDMECLSQVITQTCETAYAHHIQRLMVTGNFALLIGVDPKQVHEWYLSVYADAFEWVELPNTLGMSQYADGGILASKPYISSGAYINRMSDYCKACAFNVQDKFGDTACPFNYLYWDFLVRNESKLTENQRLSHAYSNWQKRSKSDKLKIRSRAREFLKDL